MRYAMLAAAAALFLAGMGGAQAQFYNPYTGYYAPPPPPMVAPRLPCNPMSREVYCK